MSYKGDASSFIKSSAENLEINFNSLSINEVDQDKSLSQCSEQSGACLTLKDQIDGCDAGSNSNSSNSDQIDGVADLAEDLPSNDETFYQNPDINGDGDSDVADPRQVLGSHLESTNHSVGNPSIFGEPNDLSSDSNISNLGLSGNAREMQGGSRHIIGLGNSSDSQQVAESNLSAYMNAPSSHTLSMSPWSPSDINYQGYPSPRVGHNVPRHTLTSIHPQGISNSSIRGNAMLVNSNAPGASLLDSYTNAFPQLPLIVDPNLRDDTFLSERRILPDLSHHNRHHRPAARSTRTPNHIREPNLGFQQQRTYPVALPSTNQAGRQRATINYQQFSPSPQSGPRSGVGNFELPPSPLYGPGSAFSNFGVDPFSQNGPGASAWNFEVAPSGQELGIWNEIPSSSTPAAHEHRTLFETVMQSEPRFRGPNSNIPGTFISQFGHFFGGLGVNHTPESLAAEIERNHMELLKLQLEMCDDPQLIPMRAQAVSSFTERRRYVNVTRGLTEETITELLKKRTYECGTSDPLSDVETCFICLDTYVGGGEIGELNCGHEFHSKCIKRWLLIKNECPICRSQGVTA